MSTNTLGTRRLIGWLALIGMVAVVAGVAPWKEWAAFVGQLVAGLLGK